jgi:hypothetical protein
MEPNAAQAAFFNFEASTVHELISEVQSSPNPAFTCDLLQGLASEIPTFVQWDVLSSTQGQALTAQIQAVLTAPRCK